MRKNVVLISFDDLFNYHRHRDTFGVQVQTPNLDRLSEKGNFFDAAYSNTPLCNPSRAAVMTGQSVFETGVLDNSDDFRRNVEPDETIAAAFHSAGYVTGGTAKTSIYATIHVSISFSMKARSTRHPKQLESGTSGSFQVTPLPPRQTNSLINPSPSMTPS